MISIDSKPAAGTILDTGNPICNGLLLCSPFNERAGSPQDLIAPPTTITRTNDATWVPRGVSCVPISTSVNFGNPDKLLFNQASTFSIFAVISVAGGAGANRTILRYDPAGVTRALCIFRVNSSNVLDFAFGTTAATLGSVSGSTTISAAADRAISVAAVRNVSADTLTLFLNGNQENSVTDASTGTFTLTGSTWATRYSGGGEDFNGVVMFVAIWNRAITANEVAQLHQNPYRIFKAPIKYWNFTEEFTPPPYPTDRIDWYMPFAVPAPPTIEVVSF